MKGNIGIVILVILVLLALAFISFTMFSGKKLTSSPQLSPSPTTLSEDPKYEYVKEKYNLSEEQLQILSTVNPDDNE